MILGTVTDVFLDRDLVEPRLDLVDLVHPLVRHDHDLVLDVVECEDSGVKIHLNRRIENVPRVKVRQPFQLTDHVVREAPDRASGERGESGVGRLDLGEGLSKIGQRAGEPLHRVHSDEGVAGDPLTTFDRLQEECARTLPGNSKVRGDRGQHICENRFVINHFVPIASDRCSLRLTSTPPELINHTAYSSTRLHTSQKEKGREELLSSRPLFRLTFSTSGYIRSTVLRRGCQLHHQRQRKLSNLMIFPNSECSTVILTEAIDNPIDGPIPGSSSRETPRCCASWPACRGAVPSTRSPTEDSAPCAGPRPY